jgi:hypothetical protein
VFERNQDARSKSHNLALEFGGAKIINSVRECVSTFCGGLSSRLLAVHRFCVSSIPPLAFYPQPFELFRENKLVFNWRCHASASGTPAPFIGRNSANAFAFTF